MFLLWVQTQGRRMRTRGWRQCRECGWVRKRYCGCATDKVKLMVGEIATFWVRLEAPQQRVVSWFEIILNGISRFKNSISALSWLKQRFGWYCDLGTCQDSRLGLTTTRSHHAKENYKQCLQSHVENLCMVCIVTKRMYWWINLWVTTGCKLGDRSVISVDTST